MDSSEDESSVEVMDHGFFGLDEEEVDEQLMSSWVDTNEIGTSISFDQANYISWTTAQKEITIARQNILRRLRKTSFDDYKLTDLIDYFVSALWPILDEKLNDGTHYTNDNAFSKETFERILMTFFFASSLSISTGDLYDTPLLNTELLSKKVEYMKFWDSITKLDHIKHDVQNVYLWQKIQTKVNDLCRELFLVGYNSADIRMVTIDDDKFEYNSKKKDNSLTSALKLTQFVRANRKGFNFHTLVHTCSGIPLGIEGELYGENSSDTAQRILQTQLAPGHRLLSTVPNLSSFTIFADRLYWTNQFLHGYVIPSGASIDPSTHKRVADFPYTFEQKLHPKDKRTLIHLCLLRHPIKSEFIR